MVVTALAVVCLSLVALCWRLVETHRRERERLYRLAFAETSGERIAALMPERPAVPRQKREPQGKPVGL